MIRFRQQLKWSSSIDAEYSHSSRKTVFAAMADLEREQIRQRQKEGIEIAKKNGKYQGRQPVKLDNYQFEMLYRQWQSGEITQ